MFTSTLPLLFRIMARPPLALVVDESWQFPLGPALAPHVALLSETNKEPRLTSFVVSVMDTAETTVTLTSDVGVVVAVIKPVSGWLGISHKLNAKRSIPPSKTTMTKFWISFPSIFSSSVGFHRLAGAFCCGAAGVVGVFVFGSTTREMRATESFGAVLVCGTCKTVMYKSPKKTMAKTAITAILFI